MKKLLLLLAIASAAAMTIPSMAFAKEPFKIALIPGLTTDAFYITMHKGAEAAAKEFGAELIYQGATDWNVTLQMPVLNAIIAKKPDVLSRFATPVSCNRILPALNDHIAITRNSCPAKALKSGILQHHQKFLPQRPALLPWPSHNWQRDL